MKRLLPVVCLLSCLIAAQAFAGSATWNLNPTSGDWNTATNWSPETVPHGSLDVATFGVSNVTTVLLPVDFPHPWEIGGLTFSPGASAYTIMTDHEQGQHPYATSLVVSGIGFVNDSGLTQSVVTQRGPAPAFNGLITFSNSATGGTDIIYTNNGDLSFTDTSNAGDATYLTGPDGNDWGDGPLIVFRDNANAANATFTNQGGDKAGFWGGWLLFYDQSSAATATVTNEGGTTSGASGGVTFFIDDASAADATIICNGGTTSGAAGGAVEFIYADATPANATLIANGGINGGGGGSIQFYFGAIGGLARAELFGNGNIDISELFVPNLMIGSIEGDGLVFLGQRSLIVGANNSNTKFSGVIADGGIFGGTGGSLTKTGTASLTLSGANTYTGGTTIEDGKLVVDNRDNSGTGSGPVQVNAGRLGGRGIIAGTVAVGTGSGTGAVLAPGQQKGRQNTLIIQGGLTFDSDGTYECGINTRSALTDKVVTNGVTINGGQFLLRDPRGFPLTPGTVFTVIDNTSAATISGTFSNLNDGSTMTVGSNTYQANYEGGDGNDLTLTVVP